MKIYLTDHNIWEKYSNWTHNNIRFYEEEHWAYYYFMFITETLHYKLIIRKKLVLSVWRDNLSQFDFQDQVCTTTWVFDVGQSIHHKHIKTLCISRITQKEKNNPMIWVVSGKIEHKSIRIRCLLERAYLKEKSF